MLKTLHIGQVQVLMGEQSLVYYFTLESGKVIK